MAKQELLETLWEVPDDLWAEIAPLIAELDPPKSTGRKRQDPRRMLNGIIFRLRSGCQWNQLPRSLGDDSTIHRTFQRWEQIGLFSRIWERVQSRCEEVRRIRTLGQAIIGLTYWGPSWWSGPSRRKRRRSICVWIKDMTIPRDGKRPSSTAMKPTSGALGRRSWTHRESSGAPVGGGTDFGLAVETGEI